MELHEPIPTIKERDRQLEELWAELENAAFDEDEDGRLILADRLHCFEAGTWNEDIWRWFDERYSKGVCHLMYGCDGVDRTDGIARLYYLQSLCFDCDTRSCALNSEGECRFPLVNGRKPTITEEEGCKEGAFCV